MIPRLPVVCMDESLKKWMADNKQIGFCKRIYKKFIKHHIVCMKINNYIATVLKQNPC